MLLAGIDRNKATEPEKQVSRIISPYWTLPIDRGKSFSPPSKQNHAEKGRVLRVGNRRMAERRKKVEDAAYLQNNDDRRFLQKRKASPGWSPDTHDILVVAVERKPGQKNLWQEGDKFIIRSGEMQEAVAPEKVTPPPIQKPEKNPLLVKDDENDEDYVVHLSGKPTSE